jgi:serine/threonine-protein kinase
MATMDEPRDFDTQPTALAETDLGPATLGSLAPEARDGAPRPPSTLPPLRYVLGPLIGRGGMGEIRVARDTRMGRDVAIKVLRGEGLGRDDLKARFLREARVQGRLEHPAIVPVHDLGLDDAGHPFFVMKRLTGLTLAEILARAPVEPVIAAAWPRRALLDRLVDICQAIEFAHQRGVVHRDLKPQNIMLGDFGEVYVLDWGIARIRREDDVDTGAIHREDLESLDGAETQTGALIGTPGYMAPEQFRGDAVDQRTDVYALGCILFEILTGRPALPHGSAAFEATLAAPAHAPRARAPEADVPPELDALCAAATAPRPDERLATPAALAAGLQRYLDGDRDAVRRRELADEYAAAAAGHLTSATDVTRADAMQEAGRALALDPSHQGAQAIVGRLLLEPPAVVPAPVAQSLRDHRDVAGRAHMRAAAITYVTNLAFLPFVCFAQVHNPWVIVATTAIILFNTTLLLAIARRPHPRQGALYVILIVHGLFMALAGSLATTPLILPAMAITSLAGFLSNPRVDRAAPVVAVHALAIFGTIGLELAGVIPSTFALAGGSVVSTPWAVTIPAPYLFAIVMMAAATHIIATTTMITKLRRTQEAAQQEIFVYKWHLEQLVPAHR